MWGDPTANQGGDRFSTEEAQNKRLLVRPIEYIPEIRTQRGDVVDAIKVNVVDLDDPSGPARYNGTLWFGGRLIKAFKGQLGVPFVGYITKVQLPTGFRAWDFISLSQDPQVTSAAQAWLNANPDFLSAPLPTSTPRVDPYAHHEQGPAPDWAGAVPARPPAPPIPAQRSAPLPPPPARPISAPPGLPQPVSAAPASAGESMLERLRRQAEQPFPLTGQSGDQPPPF